MKSYLSFFLTNKRLLSFGVLLAFFSSYGQTFFISLFSEHWEDELGMGKTEFGSLYSLATLISASFLPWVGRLVDEVPLPRYTMGIATGLLVGCVTMANANSILVVFVAFVILRLSGQGLCGHTAATTMARSFKEKRGKALSISGLGFPLGEGLFPLITVSMIAAIGWRKVWLVEAATVVLIMVPLILWLMRGLSAEILHPAGSPKKALAEGEKEWTRGHVLVDPRFYMLLPSLLILPFTITGIVLHQASLVEFRGWEPQVIARAFVGFAVLRILFSLLVGPMIDRFGAVRGFPFFVWPMILGLIVMAMTTETMGAYAYLASAGASLGMSSAMTASLWAELYGVRHLGAIKSLGSSIAIFGTALSPALFGWLLDRGIDFDEIIWGNVALALISSVFAFVVCTRERRKS